MFFRTLSRPVSAFTEAFEVDDEVVKARALEGEAGSEVEATWCRRCRHEVQTKAGGVLTWRRAQLPNCNIFAVPTPGPTCQYRYRPFEEIRSGISNVAFEFLFMPHQPTRRLWLLGRRDGARMDLIFLLDPCRFSAGAATPLNRFLHRA